MILAFTCDPALTALFTPAEPRSGRYEICTTAETFARTLVELAGDGVRTGTVERLEAVDAFGAAGAYDRTRLRRLYNGRRAEVVRGWRDSDGGFESITLLSPYPDASLTSLNPGTMIIRWTSSRR